MSDNDKKVEANELDLADVKDESTDNVDKDTKEEKVIISKAILFLKNDGELGVISDAAFDEMINDGTIIQDMTPYEIVENVKKLGELYKENAFVNKIANTILTIMQAQAQQIIAQGQDGQGSRTNGFNVN